MFQILNHALADPANKTKFTLIFANQTPGDILLRDEFDALAKKYPDTLKLIYALDKPEAGWAGLTGFVNKDVVSEYIPPPTLGEKVKVLVCGACSVRCRVCCDG